MRQLQKTMRLALTPVSPGAEEDARCPTLNVTILYTSGNLSQMSQTLHRVQKNMCGTTVIGISEKVPHPGVHYIDFLDSVHRCPLVSPTYFQITTCP